MFRFFCLAAVLSVTLASSGHSQAIIGSWGIRNAGQAKSTAIITFLPNGVYTMAEDGNRGLDPSGKDGMERGTYAWNASTKTLTTKTLVDTTGEWGLSNTEFKSVSVSGNKLTAVADDGSFTFDRVVGGSGALVGGWYLPTGGGSFAVVTFLPNGTYFMVQDGKPADGGRSGVERGTYTWSPVTKSFTRKLIVDTNGSFGFSDNRKRSVTVSGNKLTLSVQGEGKFVLSRVVAPK